MSINQDGAAAGGDLILAMAVHYQGADVTFDCVDCYPSSVVTTMGVTYLAPSHNLDATFADTWLCSDEYGYPNCPEGEQAQWSGCTDECQFIQGKPHHVFFCYLVLFSIIIVKLGNGI